MSHGNLYPHISYPFANAGWSPQTDESSAWYYNIRDQKLQGIRCTHQPSPWINDYGAFVVFPETKQVVISAGDRSSGIIRKETSEYREVALPNYYKAYLTRYRCWLEYSPTQRCCHFRFTFPPNPDGSLPAFVLLQPNRGTSTVTTTANGLTGNTTGNSGGVPAGFAHYYEFIADKPAIDSGVFINGVAVPGNSATGERAGGWVQFATSPTEDTVVLVRVGVSMISNAQALLNLDIELPPTQAFETTVAAGETVWAEALGAFEIEGATDAQLQTFYTMLWRSQLFPHAWHEPNGYAGAIHHRSPYSGQVVPGVMYADHGFWDVYRTNYSLLSIWNPTKCGEIMDGWVNAFREGGWFPKWCSPGYRNSMVGTHLASVAAECTVKGIAFSSPTDAYNAMLRDAYEVGDPNGSYGRVGIEHYLQLGYVPCDVGVSQNAARTLDFCYDDWCCLQMAELLNDTPNIEAFRVRSSNYRKIWDVSTSFMRPKNEDASWYSPFYPEEWGGAFVEGSAYHYTLYVQHDVAGLIDLFGGNSNFVAYFDNYMSQNPPIFRCSNTYRQEIHEITEMTLIGMGQYQHSNQPVHHDLYMYACADAPDRTQYWVRRVMNELYSAAPSGLCGDEDNGEMASWYVLSVCGFFPLTPAHPTYSLGSPLFPKITVHLESGADFVSECPTNTNPSNVYVASTSLNGQPWNKLWISHFDIANGGTLSWTTQATPATGRVWDSDYLPYSFSTHSKSRVWRQQSQTATATTATTTNNNNRNREEGGDGGAVEKLTLRINFNSKSTAVKK